MSGRHYLVDAHCHLDDPQFDADRREVIRRAWEVGVGMVSVGTNAASSRRAVALAEEHESVWACVGVHPEEIAEHQEGGESGESAMEHIAALAERSSVVAVGECGFDYARVPREEARQKQLPLFEAHIALAVKFNKPLMLHIRPSTRGASDAYEDILDVLTAWKASCPNLRGNAHFFAADAPTAHRFFDLDFTVSFTGVLTFVRDYQEVARTLPRERVLVETDAPYVAPAPHRGARNEPQFVREVARTLARLWGMREADTAWQLLHNTRVLFGVPADSEP
ncbi:TatD family deoxyribonuclease [Candidatus Parcubacteria bacterium]|nr:MAG: TatD family deoxyribonuclease [Candidatus Parcubacteria bacterium]